MLPSSSLPHHLSLAVAVLLLLGTVACDEFDTPAQTVRQDVQGAYGVDTHDSNQVGGAIASGETLGNKEASDGLTPVMDLRREDAENKGDRSLRAGNYSQAAKEYEEALRWNKLTPGKEWDYYATSARIRENLFIAIREQGERHASGVAITGPAARAAAVAAAREFGRKAQAKRGAEEPATADAAYDYFQASDLYQQAGRLEAACESLRRSRQVGQRSFNQEPAWCRERREGG